MAEAAAPAFVVRLRALSPLRALRRSLAGEGGRLILWQPVFLALGIALYFALPFEPPGWLVWLLAPLSLLLVALGWGRSELRGLALAAALPLLGFLVALLRTQAVAAPVLPAEIGPVWIAGQVAEIEVVERRPRLLLQDPEIPGLEAEATPERLRIRLLRPQAELQPGDRVRIRASLRPPPAPAMPGAFDFARQAYFQRLGAVGFALSPAEPDPSRPGAGGWPGLRDWRLAWSGLRRVLAARIAANLEGEAGAVAVALITGDRSAIPEPVLEDMRRSGLAHLLAISGLHLGLVAGLVFFAVRAVLALAPPLALRFPIKKWAAVAAAVVALAYLFLVGATIPTQRAYVMVALALGAIILDRQPISLRLLAAAAVLVLLIAPESLLSASFQMSFAAVTALVAAYELVDRRRLRGGREDTALSRFWLYLGFLLLSSVIANLATAPFAVFHFNRLALFGLAANLLAVPLTAFWIMPWALIAMLLLPLGLEGLALAPMGLGIELVLAVAERIAGWPGSVVPVRALPLWGLAATVLGGLWLCLWQQRWRLYGLAGPALGLLALATAPPPDLLVSADGGLIALRGADGGLAFSSLRRQRFQRDVWLRRSGTETAHPWPEAGEAGAAGLRCDPLGCLAEVGGRRIAIALDGRALEEDCRWAEVLVSLEPLRNRACPAPDLVVDRFDLWWDGAHALWLRGGVLRSESVEAYRGRRPWTRPRPAGSG